jgi:5-methylcytosine-specific restriction protein A
MPKRKSAKVRMLAPSVRKMDTRTVKVAPKTADPELLTKEHQAWASAVLRLAGRRCQEIENGKRCTRAWPEHRMYADHIVERRDGGALYDVKNGMCRCASHHTRKTIAERARRMAERPTA